jgi:hippurate hydrolase
MGSEDFAYMLPKRPGCYVWMGVGKGADTLAIGASYWVTLARQELGAT